ncbi:MAG: DUF2931 family protein [Pseudomonadota bacterium]
MRLKVKGSLLLLLLLSTGCSLTPPKTHEITWYFQVAAPKHYDIWVQYMEFEKSGVRAWHQAPGFVSCCWVGEDGPRGPGGRLEPFPNYVAVQWFSYAEQKMYQRLISISPDWRKKMQDRAIYFTSKGKFKAPRNILTFGLAPGGQIVVWAKNQVGNEIELDRLKANEIEGDPAKFEQASENYLERNGNYLEENGIPLEGW